MRKGLLTDPNLSIPTTGPIQLTERHTMHEYDRAELQTYLHRAVEGFGSLDDIEKFSDGQSNPTYKLTSGSKHFVLRAKPPGKLLKSAHAVDREFRVMSALASTDVPVPQMLHLSGEETPMGPQFFVMEFLEGRIFWDPALPELDPQERGAVYDAMNTALAALHNVDPAKVGLSDYGKPGNYFERQVGRWSSQYKAAETQTIADADWVMDWLAANMAEDDQSSAIVHGVYRIDNMIFATDTPQIRALLDWELSTLGHPLADLAYQCMHWRLPNVGEFRGLAGVDRAAIGLPTEEDYIATYCERRGINVPPNWPFYLVFSYFRFLAIVQGVLKRALEGNASNPRNTQMMAQFVALLAHDARKVAEAA